MHKGQIRYLHNSIDRHKKVNVLTSANRWGKTVTIACKQLWKLFYKIGLPEDDGDGSWERTGYMTANIAPHSALTEPVFKTIHQIMTSSFMIRNPATGRMTTNRCLIEWFYYKDKTINTPPYKQYFEGNALIEHRSLGADQGDSLQGKPYGYISYDEGGRSDHLETEIKDAILPRLFDLGGELDILSTPSITSKSSLYYYKLYQEGLAGVGNTYTQTGSLRDNNFFSEEQIQAQYDLYKDDPLKDQILEGKFVFGGGAIYNPEDILAAQDKSLNDTVPYQEGHKYVIGIDTAIGGDEIVFSCIDVTTKPYLLVKQIACKGNSQSPQMHLYDLIELINDYGGVNDVTMLLETWNGESVRFFMDLPPDVQSITETLGSWTPQGGRTSNKNPEKAKPNAAKKSEILVNLRKLMANHEIKIPENDSELSTQLQVYREDDTKLRTDRLMALALACYCAEELLFNPVLAWEAVGW